MRIWFVFIIFAKKKNNMSRYNKDDLERLILVERVSYAQIGRIYGVGGNAVKKAAKKMGIPVTLRSRIN